MLYNRCNLDQLDKDKPRYFDYFRQKENDLYQQNHFPELIKMNKITHMEQPIHDTSVARVHFQARKIETLEYSCARLALRMYYRPNNGNSLYEKQCDVCHAENEKYTRSVEIESFFKRLISIFS